MDKFQNFLEKNSKLQQNGILYKRKKKLEVCSIRNNQGVTKLHLLLKTVELLPLVKEVDY